jgi:hypothetical protein
MQCEYDYSIVMTTKVKGGAEKELCLATAVRTMKNVRKLPDAEILHSDWAVRGNPTHDNISILKTTSVHSPQRIQLGL